MKTKEESRIVFSLLKQECNVVNFLAKICFLKKGEIISRFFSKLTRFRIFRHRKPFFKRISHAENANFGAEGSFTLCRFFQAGRGKPKYVLNENKFLKRTGSFFAAHELVLTNFLTKNAKFFQ